MNDKVVKRARKSKQPELKGSGSLLAALKFVAEAQAKEGTQYQTHSVMFENMLYAFNGVLTIGTPIYENLNCCPHTLKLIAALNHCGEQLSISQLDSGRLSVKSGAFRALVDCIGFDQMPQSLPDAMVGFADDKLKAGLAHVAPLVTEGATHAWAGAVLVDTNTVTGCNGIALLQFWHGLELPPGILLPKVAAAVIAKVEKKVIGYGFGPNTFTVWFEDQSFIKSQLFKDQYPNIEKVFGDTSNSEAVWFNVPENFYTALSAVASLSENNIVIFKEKQLMALQDKQEVVHYAIDDMPSGFGLNASYLVAVKAAFCKCALIGNNVHFYGNNMRGALSKISV